MPKQKSYLTYQNKSFCNIINDGELCWNHNTKKFTLSKDGTDISEQLKYVNENGKEILLLKESDLVDNQTVLQMGDTIIDIKDVNNSTVNGIKGIVIAETLCNQGDYETSAWTLDKDRMCEPCPKGSYCNWISNNPKNNEHTLCETGTYQDDKGQTYCIDISGGYQGIDNTLEYISMGATGVEKCSIGKYNTDGSGACVDIGAGYEGIFALGETVFTGASHRQKCPERTYSINGEGLCNRIPDGFEGVDDSGYYTKEGATQIHMCYTGS